MNRVQQYIASAKQKNGTNRHNFVKEPMGNNFVKQSMPMNATGAGASSTAKKSMPFAVVVSSASGAAVSDFDVLGAYEYVNNAGMTAGGSLVIGSITIYSGIPGVSYRDLLYQTMDQPFTCGQTYLYCTSPVSQLLEPFTIKTKDANGTQVQIPIVPALDPYQLNQVSLVIEQEYSIDGNTKLTFSQIEPNAVLTIRWYPSVKVNTGNALDGSNTTPQYANPGIIRQ